MGDSDVIEVALRIADGEAVDWETATRSLPDDDRRVLHRLRQLEGLARAHADPTVDQAVSPWGPFEIRAHLGRGSYGDVYRARDPLLGRDVALKLLHARVVAGTDPTALVTEGHLLARIRHPNVVTVHGADRRDGRVGLWMELIEGETLAEVVRRTGPLEPAEVARIGERLAAALAAIHGAGLVHRDITARNVMREASGRVVLMDLGAGGEFAVSPTPLAGTPLYLAPEVLAGAAASARSDIYSLGVLLWYLATGDFPVTAQSLDALRAALATGPRASLRTTGASLPTRLRRAIERAVALDPSARFASALEFQRELAAVAATPRRRRIAMATLAALAIVVALIVLPLTAAGRRWLGLSEPASSARQVLAFGPRDVVLVARFENGTGEDVFDGALEYALERELLESHVVGLAGGERVRDALAMMRRPADAVVDRATALEVAARDGAIKAVLAGSIEKRGGTYVLRTELLAPRDGAIVGVNVERAADQSQVPAAVARHARRMRESLGEHLPRLSEAAGDHQQATTASLKAFQLYNRAYQLGQRGEWAASLTLAREVVRADPEFASGWIWLAWSLNNTKADRDAIRDAAQRARTLAAATPAWERLWIEGSFHSLTSNFVEALPAYRALLELRPDHYYAANNLQMALLMLGRRGEASPLFERIAALRPLDLAAQHRAASNVLASTRDVGRARPYVDRIRTLLAAGASTPNAAQGAMWVEMFEAFTAWKQRDLPRALRHVDDAVDRHRESFTVSQTGFQAGHFYLSLGRPKRAEEVMAIWRNDFADIQRLAVFPVREDLAGWRRELRRLERLPAGQQLARRPMQYLNAGLVADARRIVAAFRPDPKNPAEATLVAVGEGHLALLDGRLAKAQQVLSAAFAELRRSPTIQEYYQACRGLARVYHGLRRPIDATRQLEECSRDEPYLIESGFFGTHQWMLTRLMLADEYRRQSRDADARVIEEDLRRLLAVADADHPLRRQLAERADTVATGRELLGPMAERTVWAGDDVPLLAPFLVSISSDGRWLAHVHNATGAVAVRDLSTGQDHLLTEPANASGGGTLDSLAISPDGQAVAYAVWSRRSAGSVLELRVTSVASAPESKPRVLYVHAPGGWMGIEGWSPDGRVLINRRRPDRTAEFALVSQDGAVEIIHTLASQRTSRAMLSPDGRALLFGAAAGAQSAHNDIYIVANGVVTPVAESHAYKTAVGWTPDGQSVLFLSDTGGQTGHLMAQRVNAGRAEGPPVVVRRNVGGDFCGLTGVGDVLLCVEINDQTIYTVPVDITTGQALGKPRTSVPSFWSRTRYPKWSADGTQLATMSQGRGPGTGQRMLAIHGPAGTRILQLRLAQFWSYDWSPDARAFLARATNFEGQQGIYHIDAKSGEVTPVILNDADRLNFTPQWGDDSASFFYARRIGSEVGGSLIERTLATGVERELYDVRDLKTADGLPVPGLRDQVLSPSKRHVAGISVIDKETVLWLVSIADRRARELLRVPRANAFSTNALVWTPDSRHVIVNAQVRPGARELWAVPIDGGGQYTRLELGVENLRDGAIAIHPDGRQIAFIAGERPTSELRLLR